MGVKDQGLQEYLKDNERFADFVNGTLFAGKQIVDPRYLKEVQRKKRVSYKQSISVINTQKKNGFKNSGEETVVLEKDKFEANDFAEKKYKTYVFGKRARFFALAR